MTDRPGRPVRVAAVNDYDLIVEGMSGLLSRYPDRVQVCDRIVGGEQHFVRPKPGREGLIPIGCPNDQNPPRDFPIPLGAHDR